MTKAEIDSLLDLIERMHKQLGVAVQYMQTNDKGEGPDCSEVFQAMIDASATLKRFRYS